MDGVSKCPVMHGAVTSNNSERTTNKEWWPNQLRINILHQHDKRSSPLKIDHDYRKEFLKLDYFALKDDLKNLMTDTQKMVACRLWALWSILHKTYLACSWNI